MNIIHKVSFFEFSDIFFTDRNKYKQLTDKAKKDHIFMLFRTLAIKYPMYVYKFSNCHSISVLDAYHNLLCGKNNQYRFTKMDKVHKDKKHFLDTIPKDVLSNIQDRFGITDKEGMYYYYDNGGENNIKRIIKRIKELS